MQQRKLNLTALRNTNQALSESLALVDDAATFQRLSDVMQRTLLAGVIQHFEFVYELSIKMMQRQLRMNAASVADVNTLDFRDMLRLAARSSLIRDPEARFRYRQLRNMSSHSYNQSKA